jgi:membrane-associated protease RseP (regulator of RpoE activity)
MSDDDSTTSDDSAESDAAASAAATPEAAAPGNDATLPETNAASAAPPAAGETTAASSDRRGVFVPRWVAFLVGGLVALLLVGGAGFALGRATDDDNEARDHRPDIEARGDLPGGGGPGSGIPFPIPGGPNTPRAGGNGGGGNGGGNGGQTVPSRRVLLGVSAETATGTTKGARVAQVLSDGPAAKAGIEQDDVITKVDDTDIQTAADLVDTISGHGSGDEVTITYERNGESKTVSVTLGGVGGSSSGGSGSSSSTD